MLRADDPNSDLPSDAVRHQADPVLRLVANPWGQDWRPLSVGIDSLDVGFHVQAVAGSDDLLRNLEALRERAQGRHEPLPWEDDLLPGMLYPGAGSKSSTYRYHLRTPIGEVYLRAKPVLDGTPSVFVSFSSQALWCQGRPEALTDFMRVWLRRHGLITESIQPSRCDLAIDVHMPSGISRDRIEAHLVTRAKQRMAITDWLQFKGYAVGSRSSPIYARIYDKTLEIAQASHKFWFRDIWGEDLRSDVVRFEFQVNRSYLRDLLPPIDTLADLIARLPDLWQYLTTEWLTLRVPTNHRAARRDILPAWERLTAYGLRGFQACGTRAPLVRDHGLVGSREHLRRQGLSWLSNVAADSGIPDPGEAMRWGIEDLLGTLDLGDFRERVRAKRIKRGHALDGLEALPSKYPRPHSLPEGQP